MKKPEGRIIRLITAKYEKFLYCGTEPAISHSTYVSMPYKIPNNLSLDETCKMISYIMKKTAIKNGTTKDEKTTTMLATEEFKKFGFEELHSQDFGYHETSQSSAYCYFLIPSYKRLEIKSINGVVDLITCAGDPKIFKKSPLGKRYFEWNDPSVSQNEFKALCEKAKAENEDN